MRVSWGRGRRAGTALLLAVLLPLGLTAGAARAVTPAPVTFQDFSYDAAAPEPSAAKPQSKLWFVDGAWWALMRSPADGTPHVFELVQHAWRDTGTQVDSRAASTGDALWDGRHLYVASRQATTPTLVTSLTYSPTGRRWSVDQGFPVPVGTGGSESVTIDEDSTGHLWLTFTRAGSVWVAHSTTSVTSWTAPFHPAVPDVTVANDDISSLVAFEGKIGVLWSDQQSSTFSFAIHVDGRPDTEWSAETPLAGFDMADDHVNIKTVGGDDQGRIFAAIKTSQGDHPAPSSAMLDGVLTRSRAGTWSVAPAGTVADNLTRPILMIDETNRLLYFLATKGARIVYKTSPLGTPVFPTGVGAPFVTWPGAGINNASGSKQPVNSATGMVVLASDKTALRYYHSELGITAPPGVDTTPPGPPGNLVAGADGTGGVRLTWSAATDDVGVAGYVLRRDGQLLANVSGTAYDDVAVTPGTSYTYTVQATDAAGNVSPASAPATFTVPVDQNPPSAPTSLAATITASGAVSLTWSHSHPAGAQISYVVRRAGVDLAPAATTSYVDTSAAARTAYTYTVVAVDAAGNRSPASAPVSVATPAVLRASTAVVNDAGTAVTAPLPATHEGSVVLAAVTTRGAPVITPPAGWTLVRRDVLNTAMSQAVYVHTAAAAEPTSATWTLRSAQTASAVLLAYDGLDPLAPVMSHSGRSNSVKSKVATADSTDVTAPDAVVVGVFGTAPTAGITAPTGMLARQQIASPATFAFLLSAEAADQVVPAVGPTGPRSATLSASVVSIGTLVALRPAALATP